jgi:hypothetical protein
MPYEASRHEPPSEAMVIYGTVREHKYPPVVIAALAPARPESEPQLLMDRLLRECLKRKSLTE